MKVLQLSSRLPYPLTDGGAIGIFYLARALAESGNEVTFVSFPLESEALTQEAVERMSQFCTVRLVSRPLPSRTATILRTLFSGAYPIERRMMPEMFQLLESILEKEHFDVVHLDASHVGKYGVWIKEKFGLPVVLRQHNFETLLYERFAQTEKNPVKRALATLHAHRLRAVETAILRAMDAVVAITADDVATMKPDAPAVPFHIVPAGVDVQYFRPSEIPAESGSILWVGGMDWEPNKDALTFFLAEIFPLIISNNPKVNLHIIGSGTEAIPIASNLRSSVFLHGKVEDVRTYIDGSEVMLVPLRVGGGMRVKLLEFFSSGKAVVSTSIGAEGNLGQNEKHLLIRDEPLAFASAVLELLENREKAEYLGKNARKLAEERYSWGSIGSQLTTIYQSVVRDHQSS